MSPDVQHQGLATEATAALLDLAFETFGFHRVFARCDTRNVPSYRLMERLGMRREAHFREHIMVKGAWASEYIYAMLAEDWRRA